jgi:hypothetical protein
LVVHSIARYEKYTVPVRSFREKNYGYKIQEHKEVPVWYTGTYRLISGTGYRSETYLPILGYLGATSCLVIMRGSNGVMGNTVNLVFTTYYYGYQE